MSGSPLFASEYLNIKKVQPSFPIGKSFQKVVEISPDSNDNNDKKTIQLNELEFWGIAGRFSPLTLEIADPTLPVGFYKYYLCTNDDEPTRMNIDNVYYATSIVGEYPWTDYKKFIMDLVIKE